MPVDFEEVHVSSNADEEDIRNAIMAIRRNRVALKGELGSGWGAIHNPFCLYTDFCVSSWFQFQGFFWLLMTLILGIWVEASVGMLTTWFCYFNGLCELAQWFPPTSSVTEACLCWDLF